jgi:hypothetical protein
MPDGSTERPFETARAAVRTSVFFGLIALAIAACTTADTKQSAAEPVTVKPAPLEPPPALSAAPAPSTGQVEAPRTETAQVALTLAPATIETQASTSPGEATLNPAPQTAAAAPPPAPPVPSASPATPVAAPTESAFEDPPPDTGWPRILSSQGQTFTVYQPQLDSWDGFTLEAHAAVAVESGGEQPPIFGVVNLSAHTLVDKDERLVTLEDLKVADARFPSAPEQAQQFGEALHDALPKDVRSVSLDRLEAQLAIHQARSKAKAQPLKNAPPRIVFMQQPSLLVYIDGQPQYVALEGTNLKRVVNTRVLLLKDPTGKLYVHVLDGYMEAADLSGPWSVAKTPPPDAAKAEAIARELRQVDLLEGQEDSETKKKPSLGTGPAPQIIVAITPTELIVTEGKPNYVPISGTSLLYVKNTTANVFKLLTDQMTYVLLGGRWFRAKSFDGPWEFVAPKSLPKDFAKIPDSSPKENVKAAVPGTRQAQEALIANQIPTTARVDIKSASFAMQTDGEPKLAPIDGTSLQYVLNASAPVIRVDDKTWYACQEGLWFVSNSMSGPWAVATSVPAVIYSIPPSSPVYYVTYVRVYRAIPTYVYVGYTPGYYGAVVAPGGVVVYGTGYYYSPWVGHYWYGYPVTYGMGVGMAWTPWTGWAFGFGFGWPYGAMWYYPPAPWWGPYYGCGYNAHGGMTAWGPGGWASTTGNIYGQRAGFSTVQRGATGYNAFTGNQWATRYGTAYNSTTGTLVTGQKGAVKNVYSGNYAYGGRGTATNTRTGASVSGGKVTVGNAYTGNSTTVGGITASKPGEPPKSMVGVKGDQGSVIAVGSPGDKQVFGTKDGNVYRRGDNGQWEQVTRPSGVAKPATQPQASSRTEMASQYSSTGARRDAPSQLPGMSGSRPGNTQDLDRQRRAQDMGNQRANSFQGSRPSGGFRGSAGGGARRR